jgi:hypothetical protein
MALAPVRLALANLASGGALQLRRPAPVRATMAGLWAGHVGAAPAQCSRPPQQCALPPAGRPL